MPPNEEPLGKALGQFYKDELKGLEAATGKALRAASRNTVVKVKAQLRSNFKPSEHPSSPAFFQAVKAYNLEPRGHLGYASYVRVGIKFLSAFQEGDLIRPRRKGVLVVRLPAAEKLNLPRVNTSQSLSDILSRLPKNSVFSRKKGDSTVIFYKFREGQYIPIYKLVKSVQLTKRLSFFEIAEEEAKTIPETIERLSHG